MRYVGNIDESKIIKKNNSNNIKNDINIQKNETTINNETINNVKNNFVNNNDDFINNKIKVENEFPVFIYEQNTKTKKIEVKNIEKNIVQQKDKFNISNDKLEIIKFNNTKKILEVELDIEVLKLILEEHNIDFNFYKNKLEYLNNELYFLQRKKKFIDDMMRG